LILIVHKMINSKKNIVLIDPWGTNNTAEYLNGLIYGLKDNVNLVVFTNFYFDLSQCNMGCDIRRVFFKKSEKMDKTYKRKILRAVEYIKGYKSIIKYLKRNKKNIDIVHINWLLMYKYDILSLKKIKKYTKKVIYTAHNVLPHINGQNYISDLEKIYRIVDKVVVHGNAVKEEFIKFFPQYESKVYIQKHGSNLKPNVNFNEEFVPDNIRNKLLEYSKRFIFFGNIFYNKGIDRVVSFWNELPEDCLLVIAGKVDSDYIEFKEIYQNYGKGNILLIDEHVSDNTLNYLINNSELILLPYRHASMSGVVFTASDFSKPIFATKTGAIPEYLTEGRNAFLVENTDEAIFNSLYNVCMKYNSDTLHAMGQNLTCDINKMCNWQVVCDKLIQECYCG